MREDAGLEPGTARHEARWVSSCRVGGCSGGAVQVFEVMGAHLGCPAFLIFIVDGMGQRGCGVQAALELGDI